MAYDPLYALTNAQLRHKQAEAHALMKRFGGTAEPADWLDQKHLAQQAAFEIFHSDREHPQRYLDAALPCLPFPDDHFDLACSGHLLFSYEPVEKGGLMANGGFDLKWHDSALLELCRVSKSEVRIYPAQTIRSIAERKGDTPAASIGLAR